MISVDRTVTCPVSEGYRSSRVRSLFNPTAEQGSTFRIQTELPIDEREWQIGLVVGPSGSGKTLIGGELLGVPVHRGFRWGKNPIVEEIAPKASFEDVTGALASVGLGTVPSWLRPYSVLSNGEKFRAELARVLVERPERIVIDEFTSVVDRQVAQIGAAAFAKSWRQRPGPGRPSPYRQRS